VCGRPAPAARVPTARPAPVGRRSPSHQPPDGTHGSHRFRADPPGNG
jgi:hypothetical protein